METYHSFNYMYILKSNRNWKSNRYNIENWYLLFIYVDCFDMYEYLLKEYKMGLGIYNTYSYQPLISMEISLLYYNTLKFNIPFIHWNSFGSFFCEAFTKIPTLHPTLSVHLCLSTWYIPKVKKFKSGGRLHPWPLFLIFCFCA